MAGDNRFDVGKEFLDRLIAKMPAESRGTVEAFIATPEARETLGELGDGVLRQSDYTRQMNALAADRQKYEQTEAWHASLEEWHKQNAALVELGRQAQAGALPPTTPKGGTHPPPATSGITREELEQSLYERERGVVSFMDVANDIRDRHFETFGERIRISDLVNDPKVKDLGLEGAYMAKHGDRYRTKADEKQKALIESEVQKRLVEERKKFASQPPYPISPSEFSPLDTLGQPDDQRPKGDLAQRAADEYTQLVADKVGAGR